MRGKVYIFCLLFLFSISISGCEVSEKDGEGGDVSAHFVEMEVPGKVYKLDPDALVYEDVYGENSVEMVINDVDRADPYATYLLGVLYFYNNSRHGLDADMDKGRGLLEKAWKMGVVDAGFSLYQIYSDGVGVEKNRDLAIAYLESSAEKGHIKSQVALAKDYFDIGDSDYFGRDYSLAKKWYSRAAEEGDGESGTALAYMYRNGLGVEVDEKLAFEWMSRVESMKYDGDKYSLAGLAMYYEEGVGTDVDLVQAYKYRDLMGTAGISDKQRLAEQMTPEQIDQAVRLSGEWQREHNISMPNSEGYRYR